MGTFLVVWVDREAALVDLVRLDEGILPEMEAAVAFANILPFVEQESLNPL